MPPGHEDLDDGDDDGDDGDDGDNNEEVQTTGTPAVAVTSMNNVDPAMEQKRKEEVARSFLVGTTAMPTPARKGRKVKKGKAKGKGKNKKY